MGTYRLRMPQLGESVEEGTVVAWVQQPGAEVAEGDPLLEISTDKVDTDVESTVTGVLRRVLVDEGETVPVGAVLAEIEVEGLADEPAEDEEPASADAPAPPAAAAEAPQDAAEGPQDAAAPARARRDSGSLLLSPVVRRLVDEHGIDLDDLAVFAETPKITRKVVEDYLSRRGGPAEGEEQGAVVPFTRIRKLTAERMVASKATSPHVATAIEVDFERVAEVRAEHRDRLQADRGLRLTWLPFVAHAVARALPAFERLNASVRDADALVLHREVNLGIAVDLDGEGLVVPVVQGAHELGLLALAERIQSLAGRARQRALTADEVSGGTFTVTGQGPHGTLFTTPIINQPQVAILSVDGIRRRAVVVGDEVVARHTGILTLSWDHRAVDGVYAAGFLAALRDAIEGGDWAAELT